MSATPRGKQQRKRPVITIDDDDSVDVQQRAGKAVKIETEPAQQIVELQKEVDELKEKNEKLTRIAGEYLADKEQKKERVKVLENTIDSKKGILDGAKQEQDKLKNEVTRKGEHVEMLLKQGAIVKDELLDDRNLNLALKNDFLKEKQKNEELEKKLIDLTNQREEDRRLWSEERKRDQERIKSLTAKLEEVASLNSQQNQSMDNHQMEEQHEYDDAVNDIGNLDAIGDDLIDNGAGEEIEPKEEPIDDSLSFTDDQPFGLDFVGDEIKEEEILSDDLMEPKDEPIDAPLSGVDQQFNLEFIDAFKDEPISDEDMGNDFENLDQLDDMTENGVENSESLNNPVDIPNDSSETVEKMKRRRSSRNVSGNVKYTESADESDGEVGPSVKKGRAESVEKGDKIVHQKGRSSSKGTSQSRIQKKSEDDSKGNNTVKNELECPECEYRSSSVSAWQAHLRVKHSTTPVLAGCLIRCDCGYESYSQSHSLECEIAKFTIIRKGDGSIRRLTDAPMTPQCILCDAYPKTACGYARHYAEHHKSSLSANGIYLICSCGTRYNGHYDHRKHDNACDGRDFSMHRLEEC